MKKFIGFAILVGISIFVIKKLLSPPDKENIREKRKIPPPRTKCPENIEKILEILEKIDKLKRKI